jgi:hypothetical protein
LFVVVETGFLYVTQAGFRTLNLPASASVVLGLQVCATHAWVILIFSIKICVSQLSVTDKMPKIYKLERGKVYFGPWFQSTVGCLNSWSMQQRKLPA